VLFPGERAVTVDGTFAPIHETGMRVRLTRKLAERLDGIDVSGCHVGDELDLSPANARLLVAERWAIILAERRHGNQGPRGRERRRKRSD
jgi:hypothetical protein